jgi:hypothetical protein
MPFTQEFTGSSVHVLSLAPNSARVVTISGGRIELVESTCYFSFTNGLTHPRNRVRKSDTEPFTNFTSSRAKVYLNRLLCPVR